MAESTLNKRRDWVDKKLDDPEFREMFLAELHEQHQEDIRVAVKAETERCARRVELTPTIRGRVVHTPREIAAAIRRAPEPSAAEEK